MDKSLSYVKGATKSEDDMFPWTTTFGYVDHWAKLWPDKEAYVFRPSETEREVVAYGQLKCATENLAVWMMRELNVKRGDRVGILSLNRLAYVLCDLALSRLGALSVRIYVSMSTKDDLTRSLGTTDCRFLLCQQESLASLESITALKNHNIDQRLVVEDLPRLEQVVCMTGQSCPGTIPLPDWNDIVVSDDERRRLTEIQSTIGVNDDCTIYSTSGSTGIPKFVVHCHAGVMSLPPGLLRRCGMTADDRYFVDRPLAHLGGNPMSVITLGATMVIANPWKTLAGNQSAYLLTIMKEERVNCGLSFPYILYDIVKDSVASEQFKNLNAKFFIFGGQVTHPEIVKVVKDRLEAPVVQGYGTTEVGEICGTSPSDSFEIMSKYSGKVLPGIAVKIVSQETREIVPRGEVGTIGIKPGHQWYYLNNEKKMQESNDEEGFFYPGDVGRMAEDGNIQILGREDDQMSVGTIKVYPGPIEMMICKHPAVDKAMVFGVPDERLHEVIGAVVLPKPGETLSSDDIIKFFEDSVDEANLMTGSVMAPKFVWIEEAFPVTSSGKVDKKQMRQKCLNSLGIKDST